jgi:hypothetical protein
MAKKSSRVFCTHDGQERFLPARNIHECFLPARKIADFRTSNVGKSNENEPQASRLIS